jgi:hypothetical protein
VKTKNSAKKDPPEEKGPSSEEQERCAQNCHGYPMPLTHPDVEPVFAKVRDKGKKNSGVVVNTLTGDDPAHMGPQATILRRMWVAFLICVLVVHAMDGDPEDRASF